MQKQIVSNVSPNRFARGFTYTRGPELGLFRLRGTNPNAPIQNHQFILTSVQDTGHRLLINVFYRNKDRFVIENASEPASGAIFSFKHSGLTKKSFKPGEIISPPESYVLTWIAPNPEGQESLVTLTLLPLFSLKGLLVHYTCKPTN